MRDVAAWLVARPQNAIPVLSITLLVPILQPLSGVVLVLLILAQGVRRASSQAILAAGFVAIALMLSGMSVQQVVFIVAVAWVPLFLMAWSMVATRSFALTMQGSLIVAAVAAVLTGVLIDDAVRFWQPLISVWLEIFGQSAGETGDTSLMSYPEFAENLGALFVATAWFMYALLFLAGYRLFGQVEAKFGAFGRIRELNFGRVVASGLVLMIVLSAVTGSKLFDLAAIVLFAAFLLQAWALMYWIFAERGWPKGAFYAICIVSAIVGYLSALLMVIGYLDAWFRLRSRVIKT